MAARGLEVYTPRVFRGWSSLVEAFLARQIDVAHFLFPIPIWLRYARRLPVKVVAWSHTNGSAVTVSDDVRSIEQLSGRTVAIPFWYSTHNVILQHVLRSRGLEPVIRQRPAEGQVELVVMSPPEMPIALANRSISGYIVADPFNAQAESAGLGRILRFSGDVWAEHGDCVVVMHESDLMERPDWSSAVIASIVEAHRWTRDNLEEAADQLTGYLPQDLDVIRRILLDQGRRDRVQHAEWEPNRWIDFKPFPFPTYTELVVKLLKQTGVEGDRAFLDHLAAESVHRDLVDDRFVVEAIRSQGGPSVFGLPSDLTRSERLVGWP